LVQCWWKRCESCYWRRTNNYQFF